jgi:hypothetical protein
MAPQNIPTIKELLRGISFEQSQAQARAAMQL